MRAGRAWARDNELTYGIGGEVRAYEVDLVPRVISRHEWKQIASGLVQRARALEAFLNDVYGEQRILNDGVIPRSAVQDATGWHDAARRIPPGAVRAPVMAFDLVRNEFGSWRVLEDDVRNPSGAAYALAVRRLMNAVATEVPRPKGMLDPEALFGSLRQALLAGSNFGATSSRGSAADHHPTTHSDADAQSESESESDSESDSDSASATLALLTSGPSSSAWFEHRTLAEGAGLLLLEVDDVAVSDGRVVERASGRPIDALYLRLDGELPDAVDSSGAAIGRDIMAVAEAGRVYLANAPGNGVADHKAMYSNVPGLIGYYLDERPELEQVPTYRTSDESERRAVLERVGELVTKPVDGHGGEGVLIGPASSAGAVASRRAEISASPAGWIAQEVVALSSHPTFSEPDASTTSRAGAGDIEAVLEPRHVDLRVFVYATGDEASPFAVADVALTRVAPAGTMVVDCSRGGGAKDTWIIGEVD